MHSHWWQAQHASLLVQVISCIPCSWLGQGQDKLSSQDRLSLPWPTKHTARPQVALRAIPVRCLALDGVIKPVCLGMWRMKGGGDCQLSIPEIESAAHRNTHASVNLTKLPCATHLQFVAALPRPQQAAFAIREEEGKSAANKLNKMLWWLQVICVLRS